MAWCGSPLDEQAWGSHGLLDCCFYGLIFCRRRDAAATPPKMSYGWGRVPQSEKERCGRNWEESETERESSAATVPASCSSWTPLGPIRCPSDLLGAVALFTPVKHSQLVSKK